MRRILVAALAVATVGLGGGTATAVAAHSGHPVQVVTSPPVDLGDSPPTFGVTTTPLACSGGTLILKQTGTSWSAPLDDGTDSEDSTFVGTDVFSYKNKHVSLVQDTEQHYIELNYYSTLTDFIGSGPIPFTYSDSGVSSYYVSDGNLTVSRGVVFPSGQGIDMCTVLGLGQGTP